jgi:hypothetical protein
VENIKLFDFTWYQSNQKTNAKISPSAEIFCLRFFSFPLITSYICCSSMAAEPALPQLVTFSNFNLNKLTQDNYPTWLPQVIPHLKGGNLFGYVDGSIPCPPPSITTMKEHISSTTTNLACLHWEMQDQIILGFLTSAISERMISHVANCTTSKQAWTKLETLFASQSKAHILNMHFQLATFKKANLSIVDYFHKFQTLIDALAAVNKPLSDLEKQSFLLAGLGVRIHPFCHLCYNKS